ncbi:uncharacterized protein LOC134927845 isoform X2 [Pseudophryne corroboree]|uniref:uncharacterized protein LOC134927845 isoform X2 n=1 Tax=Pseudophryne corroboree TaxID=495146 RepID=UPI00308182A6
MFKMSCTGEDPSHSIKRAYFCKICRVACLNKSNLYSHYSGEKHKKTEYTLKGSRYGQHDYSCLQDYITNRRRNEPLIGLQYIIQFPHLNHADDFTCTLCNKTGDIDFIIKHLNSYRHRLKYLSLKYSYLFPLYSRDLPYTIKRSILREYAVETELLEREQVERCAQSRSSSRDGVKDDFWKYINKKDKLDDHNKLSEAQKEDILKYMEQFMIQSSEEAALAKNFEVELEAAANVYCRNAGTVLDYLCNYGRDKCLERKDRNYSDHKSRMKFVWNTKESIPSANEAKVSPSEKSSVKGDSGTRKRARDDSTDPLPKFTFSIASEKKPKTSGLQQEQHTPIASSSTSHTEQAVLSSSELKETTEATHRTTKVSWSVSEETRLRRIRQNSTDIAKWEALFTEHNPDKTHSKISWGTKSQLINLEVEEVDEKKEKVRRDSLEALSTFTLFSASSSVTSPFLSYKSQLPKVKKSHSKCEDKVSHDAIDDLEHEQQEFSCSTSSHLVNVTMTETSNNNLMATDADQHDGECSPVFNVAGNSDLQDNAAESHQNSNFEITCDHLSNVNTDMESTSGFNQEVDTHSIHNFDLETCASGHSDTNIDARDSPSSVSDSTLPSSKLQDYGRNLSPEVLQLFKGKDKESIIHILKTLSPFYPALQEMNLEIFAKELRGDSP